VGDDVLTRLRQSKIGDRTVGKTPASLSSLKKLIKQTPNLQELYELLGHMQSDAHDRGAALTAGAILEGALKEALVTRFDHSLKTEPDYLFSHNAPLGTFSAKIRLGRATGIFEKDAADDLDCIREVRNAFAHTMFRLSFTTREITTACARLKKVDRVETEVLGRPPTARSRYLVSATTYAIALYKYSVGEGDEWIAFLSPKRFKAKIMAEALKSRPAQDDRE
jgi:DNA-binding MltR family transcriptional regulator